MLGGLIAKLVGQMPTLEEIERTSVNALQDYKRYERKVVFKLIGWLAGIAALIALLARHR